MQANWKSTCPKYSPANLKYSTKRVLDDTTPAATPQDSTPTTTPQDSNPGTSTSQAAITASQESALLAQVDAVPTSSVNPETGNPYTDSELQNQYSSTASNYLNAIDKDPFLSSEEKDFLNTLHSNGINQALTPNNLNTAYTENPFNPDYSYPDQPSSGLVNNTLFIPVRIENGIPIPTDIKGKPLDLVKNNKYPKSCNCFKNITAQPAQKLLLWENNVKVCVRKDPSQTSLSYLSSMSKLRTCKLSNKCQKYFCKLDNQTCPIIDAWFSEVNPYDFTTTYTPPQLFSNGTITRMPLYGINYMQQVTLPIS